MGCDNNKDDDYNSRNDLYLDRTLYFISRPLLLVVGTLSPASLKMKELGHREVK